jgi:hypothetical protein
MTLLHSSSVADYWRYDNGVIEQRYHSTKPHSNKHDVMYVANDEEGQAIRRQLHKAGLVRYHCYRCPAEGFYGKGYFSKCGNVNKSRAKVIYLRFKN